MTGEYGMKKEVDFITDYRQEKEQLCTIEKISLSKQDLQHFELTKELINAQESQFIIEKNKEKWNNLENIFYPVLCQIAKVQGGRVELKIDEETLYGYLIYSGEELILGNINCRDLFHFSSLVAASNDIFISVHEECFKLEFSFQLFDKIFAEDHKEEITKIKAKMKCLNFENLLNSIINFN